MPLKIEPVSRSHNRRSFDCGSLDLKHYLQNTARQQTEKGISRTCVPVEDNDPNEVLGFFTLTACEILVEKLPLRFAKKYPMRASAAKLARLAVAKSFQKQGFGTFMMLNAMERVLLVAEHLGVIGFFGDAKDEGAAGYYTQFGFIPLTDRPLELFLPIATIRKAFYFWFRNLPRYSRRSRPALMRRAARGRATRDLRGDRAPPGGGGNFTWPT